ncbi:SMP-30/gluconolactonase/LRE family protein [Nonomuraea antimicrobica]|uniref:SMP-30/gluconolactonase/LRE family protein n=1 Tax=Nonomuraea antimicrobica TaxID=561173 RepID=A0ABP7DBE2_9ACTN
MSVARWAAEPWLDLQLELGEGPVWDYRSQELLFLDIHAGELYAADQAGRTTVRGLGQMIGAVGLRGESGYVLGTSGGFGLLDAGSARPRAFSDLELPEGVRMNDCQVGPDGAFWGGSMHRISEPGRGGAYRLAPDGTVTTFIDTVTTSNGVGWSPDDRMMYYTDSATHAIDAFDFDPEAGTATNRRPLIDVPEGLPDGLCVDAEGSIWVAVFHAGAVHRYAPNGDLTGVVTVPANLVTSCCFGGPDLGTLYITSASAGITFWERHAQHAGAVFAVDVGVSGRPAFVF